MTFASGIIKVFLMKQLYGVERKVVKREKQQQQQLKRVGKWQRLFAHAAPQVNVYETNESPRIMPQYGRWIKATPAHAG